MYTYTMILIPIAGASLPAVSNALFVTLLFSMTHAILGVVVWVMRAGGDDGELRDRKSVV